MENQKPLYPIKILAALNTVMAQVGYVQKKGKNNFQNYKYAGEGNLLEALRPAMVDAGLLLIPSHRHVSEIDANGITTVTVDYTLAHKDGDVWPEKITAYGAGGDKNSKGIGDKGLYKALTGANKYLLFKLFQIETGDDPEKDAEHDKPENKSGDVVDHPKNPPGVSAVKVGVGEFFRNLEGCSDPDSLGAYLDDADTKRFAIKVCAEFPGEWVSQDGAGLRGLIEKAGKRCKAESETTTWIVKCEAASRKPQQKAA